MIEELRISSLGVIEESLLELGPGFSVITGETGAGKTMLVTALGLLLGGRADSGAVRTGAKSARVEGVFQCPSATVVRVEELGGEAESGPAGVSEVLLARQVSGEGRSRAYVGGAAVPASALSGLTDALVAVHGQSDQHRLLRPEAQRAALDAYAGGAIDDELATYSETYERYRAATVELRALIEEARERAREADLLRHGLSEVEAVGPQPGEEETLAEEEARLGHADALRAGAEHARAALSSETDEADALGAVGTARRALAEVRDHDPAAAELADRLGEVAYLLSDVAADVASYAAGLETDPARLAAVSERRAALTGLTRKYGDNVSEVLAWAEDGAARLQELDGTDERIEELRSVRASCRERLGGLAATISAARRDRSTALARAVTSELTGLAMPHARLEVVVSQRDAAEHEDALAIDGRRLRFGPTGVDEVELVLAANKGADARALGKGASGGELSRVMLALEVVLAGTTSMPTFVFDEVDAGVGGKAAVEIGRRLARLAQDAQVVVVTHLPQVAAFADRHVVVRKSGDGSVTTSGVTVLDEAGRVSELSRMLAGLEDSDTAVAHAEELLDHARQDKRAAR